MPLDGDNVQWVFVKLTDRRHYYGESGTVGGKKK